MPTTKMTRKEAIELHATLKNAIEVENSWPMEFFYFLRKNRDKLKTDVTSFSETNDQQLKAFRDALRVDGVLAGEKAANPYRIKNVDKYDVFAEKFAATLDESDEFLKVDVEFDLHVYQGKVPDGVPSRILNKLCDHGLIKDGPENEKKPEPNRG